MELDPQHKYRDFYRSAPHPELGAARFEGLPFQLSRARWRMEVGAPCLGQHTLDVLTRVLGLSEGQVAELIAEAAL
jgi:crotonobetainyl-CoA:carnitine CoA-transferase CaiB-like acyl-CoA transferase